MTSPFEHPEIKELFGRLIGTLLDESDRGALLVGASYVDNHLRALIEAVFPDDLGKKKRRDLLEYPGPLSTFSARTEVAYALRLIPREVYEAVSALRKLRNEVAHNPDAFQLTEHRGEVGLIYRLSEDLPVEIRRSALEMMFEAKTQAVLERMREWEAEDPELRNHTLKSKAEVVQWLSEHPDVLEALEKELPQWELVVGLSLLCSMIVFHREKAVRVPSRD